MHARISKRLIGATIVTAVLGAGALLTFACGFDPPPKSGGGKKASCETEPGKLPPADCDDSDNTCTAGGCAIEAKCGDPDSCLPMADNAGKSTLDFRIRRLNVAAPATLAEAFIQGTVVTKNIDLKAPECGELGNGDFNWLIRIDKTANTLTTGGAPTSTDPFGLGYCFYDVTPPGGDRIGPVTVGVKSPQADTYETDVLDKLRIPIFLDGDTSNVIILPVTKAVLKDVKVQNDGNCIGRLNQQALETDCTDDPAICSKWQTAGALGGYITLEEADKVEVKDLNATLCVLLAKATKNENNACPRDDGGKLTVKGDYCSETQSAGGCQDSFWMAATFAASAVTIHDGTGVAGCEGGGNPDAGADAAPDAPSDASGDAPSDAPTD